MTTYIYRVVWDKCTQFGRDFYQQLYPTKEPAFAEAERAFKDGAEDIEIELMESKLTSLGQSPFTAVMTWLVDDKGIIY